MPREEVRFVDAHLDLACIHLEGSDIRSEPADETKQCVSLPGLRAAGIGLVCATIFTEKGEEAAGKPIGYAPWDDVDGAERAGLRQLHLYHCWEREGELAIMRRGEELSSLEGTDRQVGSGTQSRTCWPHIVLLMEGADPIRDPSFVPFWFEQGVRMVGLTWAHGSRYATGNSVGHDTTVGLTDIGRELVRALDRHGIIHDVSHLSDRAFEDLAGMVGGPVVASHSNPRALMNDVQRHIRDDQIAWIAKRGGIVGLNLFSMFLAQGRRAEIDDCVRAIEHVCGVMGHRQGVGLGSDMDGGFTPTDLPVGLDHPSKLGNLLAGLRAAGWSEEEVEGFARGNWLRFLRSAMP